ncbi:hypothetical protein [Olleya sp. Hel_I_94]|uniref:hypothetical protein n=1 Tax=Olleya sp. Hel_I_94 TaxID=1250001 RepID=UPI00119EB9D9|nr:hypothetical protein [Olleya sp. Hel_I_94]TVZ47432.1 hypothetical protein JM82_2039 [Olleya sp. Hel_I_94]
MKLLTGFYIFVLIASLLTINNNLINLLNPTIIISLIGIASAILFFTKKSSFYYLGIIWIIAQIPYLIFGEHTIDFSQFLHIHFSLNIGSVSLGLNAQIFLILFIKPLLLSEFLFQKVTFKAYTENNKLKRESEYSFIPTDIVGQKLVGNSEIEIENEMYSKVKFVPTKSERIKKAGITLIPDNKIGEIKATVEYKLN